MLAERRARISKESDVLAQALREGRDRFFSEISVITPGDVKKLRRMNRDLAKLHRKAANNTDDLQESALSYARSAFLFTQSDKLFSAGRMRRQEAKAYRTLMRKAQVSGDSPSMRRFADDYTDSHGLAKRFSPFKVFVKYPVLRTYHKIQYSI